MMVSGCRAVDRAAASIRGPRFSALSAHIRTPDPAEVADAAVTPDTVHTPDTAGQSAAAPPCPRRVTGSACAL